MKIDMKLELVPVPVSEIDRAKDFYVDKLGFAADVDVQPTESVRIVQLTPPGSACSIVLSTGLPNLADMRPGTTRVCTWSYKTSTWRVPPSPTGAGRSTRSTRTTEASNTPHSAIRTATPGSSKKCPWRSADFT